ncbi:MAG TPA: sigma-54-dependent Fis family transcriptional regulator [Desulfobulbaceae bacterium]|nr:sigma-54-dependent Fis family transcriptional regulator [Desulfobulbaceae bacterium]
MKSIIVVDDDPTAGKILVRMLRTDYRVQAFTCSRRALAHFMEHGADIIITDLKMPEMDGMELLGRVKEINSETIVFIVTGYASVDGAVRAMKMGAHDYLAKPFNPDDVLVKLTRAIREQRLEKQCSSYRQREDRSAGDSSIITGNEQMLATMAMARKAARTDSNILILGETGVGKELLVKKIHQWSPRRDNLLVPINCSAVAGGIMESELFGHEKGAFTGADKTRIGYFEMADKGTLFLDEIGTTDIRFQVNLLRALQERMIYRVGSPRPIRINVRLVAAANQDLAEEVRAGHFRQDLFYRLSVVTITIPPLRERMDDVGLLADHFLRKYHHINPSVRGVSTEGYGMLQDYGYPGNIRELENIIERAMIIETTDTLRPESLLIPRQERSGRETTSNPGSSAAGPGDIREMEKKHIIEVLAACNGKKIEAARRLGINKTTLWRKMKRYGI